MKQLLLLFFIVTFASLNGIAQKKAGKDKDQACALTLKEAQRLYQQGLIENIPNMLTPCMKKGFTRQERQDAYKLIMACFLYDDNEIAADSTMLRFLKKYPDYVVNPTDPKAFANLFNSYSNPAIFSLGITGGINLPQFYVSESYGNNLNGPPRQYKRSGTGLRGGLQLNTSISTRLELGIGIFYSVSRFKTIDNFNFLKAAELLTVDETQNRLEFPVYLRYNFKPYKKFMPYVRLGIVPGYLLQATAAESRIFIDGASQNNLPATSNDIIGLRKQFGIWALAGAGIKYNFPPYGYVFIDISYQPGFTSQLNKSQRYSNSVIYDHNSKYFYNSDDFRLSHLVITAGYSFSFYKPSKKQTK